jgi:murein DD-endopeptidase MepM/ murein hydrolase activator NlpD
MSDTPLASVTGTGLAIGQAGKAPQTPEQLRTLAAQFESLLLTQLLNTMRSSMFGDEADDDSGFAKGPLADALYSELSVALGRAGGFGLGESVMAPLLRQTGVGADTLRAHGLDPSGEPTDLLPLADPGRASLDLSTPTSFLSARVTSSYGWRRDPFDGALRLHKGTDLAMPIGQEVPAARAGRISFAGEMSGYGLTVLIDHGGGRATRYAHLSELSVKAGEVVVDGQVIARSGASGRATGPHLHFELLQDGQPVDPTGRLGLVGSAIQISD